MYEMSPDDIYQLLEQKLRARRMELVAAREQGAGEGECGELELVEAAIARFESGDYGVCALCLQAVALDCLQRDPAVPYCGSCDREMRGDNIV